MGMITLAISIVAFFFIYQRRIAAKQKELALLEVQYQKELVAATIQTRELEQRRIALELHDDVGSTLTAIKFSIPSLEIPEKEREKLSNNLAMAIQKVRRISNDLLPSILEELGLNVAVRSLIKSLNESNALKYSVETSEERVRHSKDVELAIYRVLQELLNNILKYAEAQHVQVELIVTPIGIRLTVSDDGKGFIPEDHRERDRPSLGLKNMESRMQQINGTIHYEKIQPTGTRVTLDWKSDE